MADSLWLTSDVDVACQSYIGLSHGTEQGTVMDQPGDAVVDNDLTKVFIVQDVRVDEGSWRGRGSKKTLNLQHVSLRQQEGRELERGSE